MQNHGSSRKRQVGPGAVTSQYEVTRVKMLQNLHVQGVVNGGYGKLACDGGTNRSDSSKTVTQTGGKWILGSEAVIKRHDGAVCDTRQAAQHSAVAADNASHDAEAVAMGHALLFITSSKATTMDEQNDASKGRCCGHGGRWDARRCSARKPAIDIVCNALDAIAGGPRVHQ